MLGGHYWSDLPASYLPTQEEAIAQAKTAVARHLNLPPDLTQHAVASAKLCRDCIPQHLVGHAGRMRAAHGELEWGFKGRLAVAGQSYQQPGVLGMLRAARDVAEAAAGGVPDSWDVGDTGLKRFLAPAEYRRVEMSTLPLRFGSGAWVDENGGFTRGRRRG
ncbi:oxygen-dependent protoporphyrinogen oxidase [Collariella sp. IMI 366227]|nr:oxygen-dependent protoporphyrinogen oxidase [Collariella sp. IMI 366227]